MKKLTEETVVNLSPRKPRVCFDFSVRSATAGFFSLSSENFSVPDWYRDELTCTVFSAVVLTNVVTDSLLMPTCSNLAYMAEPMVVTRLSPCFKTEVPEVQSLSIEGFENQPPNKPASSLASSA